MYALDSVGSRRDRDALKYMMIISTKFGNFWRPVGRSIRPYNILSNNLLDCTYLTWPCAPCRAISSSFKTQINLEFYEDFPWYVRLILFKVDKFWRPASGPNSPWKRWLATFFGLHCWFGSAGRQASLDCTVGLIWSIFVSPYLLSSIDLKFYEDVP